MKPQARTATMPIERAALALVCVLILVLCGLLMRAFVGSAAAQGRALQAQLALELAVVAAHEGALDNVDDTNLIWQVIEARASSVAGRLALLRAHSPRALGYEPCAAGNCVWSVELLLAPDQPPASLSSSWWNDVRADSWALVQRRALGLVYGIDEERPCDRAPYSWGYAGDLESAYLERGLVPLGCVGTLNDGFVFASRAVPAALAKGSTR